MKIRHDEIEIPTDNPFANCKLNRKPYAEILTNIVSSFSDGFVLAINNEWGTGKTTFAKMWRQSLTNENFRTLYFNAWENDFDSDPLVALMAELKTLQNNSNKALFNSLISKGSTITKNVLPALFKAIAAKYIDQEILQDAIENTTKAATEILEDEIKEYTSKKMNLLEFKKNLEEFIKKVDSDKPIIFIIDELDRCKPNYAVEVLEYIKHFFSVKGIVFVLTIDKEQLENAIRGVYGSERINAEEYLRRFIDLEYKIEPPESKEFCNYLFDYFDFNSFFLSKERQQFREVSDDRNVFLRMATLLFKNANLSLRQQEKIFAHARIVLNSFEYNYFVFPTLLAFLVYSRQFHREYYNKIKRKEFDLDSLLDELHKILPKNIDDNDINIFTFLEANLVYTYFNYAFEFSRTGLVKPGENGQDTAIVSSRINKKQTNTFTNQLKSLVENWNMNNTPIDFLMARIDLTKSFTT